jgi:hypothetical protein
MQEYTGKSIGNHLKHLLPFIFYSFLVFFLTIYVRFNHIGIPVVMNIIYLFYIVISVLNVYLHIEYCLINKGVRLLLDRENRIIKYYKGREEYIIYPEDILGIELYRSFNYEKKGGFMLTDNYRFCKLILNDKKEIVITSLLYPSLKFELEEKVKIAERFIPN